MMTVTSTIGTFVEDILPIIHGHTKNFQLKIAGSHTLSAATVGVRMNNLVRNFFGDKVTATFQHREGIYDVFFVSLHHWSVGGA